MTFSARLLLCLYIAAVSNVDVFPYPERLKPEAGIVSQSAYHIHTQEAHQQLRELICQDAWSQPVTEGGTMGDITTLVFFPDGRLRFLVIDDTGGFTACGSWSLESYKDRQVLTIGTNLMATCTSFYVEWDKSENVLQLYCDAATEIRLERAKGFDRNALACPVHPTKP